MKKDLRLKLIEEIIAGGNISSQEQLLRIMEDRGIKCTQATLSRDLRQIGVGRLSDGGGTPYYRVVRGGQVSPGSASEVYHRAIVSLQWAKDLLVMKTSPGFAAGVASTVDSAEYTSIAGTVAGDDTILLIPADGFSKADVIRSLAEIFPGVDTLRKN
ncbi:MAG: ArgR family transcriptional regulator [Bacteroidales bacterium]|nr:ArgR family transcriptional regulator [Bacteroidales bacterium]